MAFAHWTTFVVIAAWLLLVILPATRFFPHKATWKAILLLVALTAVLFVALSIAAQKY